MPAASRSLPLMGAHASRGVAACRGEHPRAARRAAARGLPLGRGPGSVRRRGEGRRRRLALRAPGQLRRRGPHRVHGALLGRVRPAAGDRLGGAGHLPARDGPRGARRPARAVDRMGRNWPPPTRTGSRPRSRCSTTRASPGATTTYRGRSCCPATVPRPTSPTSDRHAPTKHFGASRREHARPDGGTTRVLVSECALSESGRRSARRPAGR